VRGKGVVLRGQKLEATIKTREVRLNGGVEMIFEPKAVNISLPANSSSRFSALLLR
jgi:hypothetical protein